MKTVISLVIFVFVFSLAGCNNEPASLDAPSNLQQEEYTLTWDAVEGATHYVVRIDGNVTHTVTETSFDFITLTNGTYEVDVRAMNQDVLSPYSDQMNIVIDREFPHPTNLDITNETILTWDDIDAVSYRIYIDNLMYTSVSDTTSYDLSDLDVNASYEISIEAVYNLGTSDKSPSITFHYYDTVVDDYTVTYNVNSDLDVLLTLDESFTVSSISLEDEDVNDANFTISIHHLTMNASYLSTLTPDTYAFILSTSIGLVKVEVEVVDNLTPYIASNQSVNYYSDEDIVFHVETFGKGINPLSGNNITEDDYTFTNSVLTIHSSYVESILDDNPDRETIILALPLIHGESDIIITYIFINTNT